MIRIADPERQQRRLEGRVVLDHASVVTAYIDLRLGNAGSPSVRCDVAFGIAENGRFVPHDYRESVVPLVVQAEHITCAEGWMERAEKRELQRCLGNILDAALYWIEEQLVESKHFGEGAEVIEEEK